MSATLTEMTMQEVLESDFQTQHAALGALVKALKPAKGGRRKASPEDGDKAPRPANDYMVLVNKVVLPVLRAMAEETDDAEEKTTLMSASCRSQIASLWFYNAERNPAYSALKDMTPDERKEAMDAISEEEIRTAYEEWDADRPEAHCKADKDARSVASKGSSATSKASRKAPLEDVAELVQKLAAKQLDIKETTMDNLKRLWSELTGEEKPPSKLTRKKEELFAECQRLQSEAAPKPKPKATVAPKAAPKPKAEPKVEAPKPAPKPKEEPIPVSNAAQGGPADDEEEDEFSEEAEEDEEEQTNLPDGRIKVMLKPNGTDAQKAYWTLEKDKKTFIWDGDSMEFLGLYFKNNNKIHAKAIDPLDGN